MHRHLNPLQWALAFGDPNDRHGLQLYGCPRCSGARGDLETWIRSVAECPQCWPAFEGYEPIPSDALDCDVCNAAYDEFERWLERVEHFEPLVAPEWEMAETLLADIAELPIEEQLARVAADPELRLWGVCQRLLEECRETWNRDPRRALSRARLAVAVADSLDEEDYHPRWVADLRAKAHGYLANAHRITGDLRAAEAEFAQAERWVERGVGQGRAEMAVLDLKASLLRHQRRYLEADALLERAERHYRDFDQAEKLARALIKRAIVSYFRELPQRALAQIDEALDILDPSAHPALHHIALQNRIDYLLDCGRHADAQTALAELPLPEDRMVGFRRTWIEANIHLAQGGADQAAVLYDDLRIAFLAEELHFDVALVSLHLAVIARMKGDHDTVRELARDALVLLTRAGATQDAFAAIRLLVDAVEHQAVSTAFIQKVARDLARLKVST